MSTRETNTGTRTRAFLIDLGSLFDIKGEATYEALREMMPAPEPYNLNASLLRANRNLRQVSR